VLIDLVEAQRNLSPRSEVAALRISHETGKPELVRLLWWLVPSWSREISYKFSKFIARLDGLESKASFRHTLQSQCCLIPADCYYEWKEPEPKKKVPYAVRRKDGGLLFLAGLWDRWDKSTPTIEYCTITTTGAAEHMRGLHLRMPVTVAGLLAVKINQD